MSRSPCGERGLKSPTTIQNNFSVGRSPCGERGLKFASQPEIALLMQSLPVRGAWVEIHALRWFHRRSPRRSPCGERGLKFARDLFLDVNDVSLPVRGAWVEMR